MLFSCCGFLGSFFSSSRDAFAGPRWMMGGWSRYSPCTCTHVPATGTCMFVIMCQNWSSKLEGTTGCWLVGWRRASPPVVEEAQASVHHCRTHYLPSHASYLRGSMSGTKKRAGEEEEDGSGSGSGDGGDLHLRPTDVICGRGRYSQHPGNLTFLSLIRQRKAAYRDAPDRATKSRLAGEVRAAVMEGLDPPGRFVQRRWRYSKEATARGGPWRRGRRGRRRRARPLRDRRGGPDDGEDQAGPPREGECM